MKMLMKAIKPHLTAGRSCGSWGKFFSLQVHYDCNSLIHEVEQKLRIVGLLQIQADNRQLELWPSDTDQIYVSNLISKLNVSSRDLLIGVNPNSLQKADLWLEERFASLADILIERYKAKVVFCQSLIDKRRVNAITSLMRNQPLTITESLNLSQFICLVKNFKAFITLDSGSMHIAGVFKIPTIALFGGEEPIRFCPYLNDRAIIVQKKVGCNPCNKKLQCKKRVCMEAITVNDVVGAFEELHSKYLQ